LSAGQKNSRKYDRENTPVTQICTNKLKQMKRNILIYGLLSGLVISVLMAFLVSWCVKSGDFESSMWVGYASMLIAFSMIFVGIKNYRDKYNGGLISFGKAFKIGFFMTLIASAIYVIVWMIEEQLFFPNFMEQYTAHEIARLQSSGLSASKLASEIKQLEQAKEMYQNPALRILMTFVEIFPVGLIVTLISSLLLKRKNNPQQFNTQAI
jgi:MFS family permease